MEKLFFLITDIGLLIVVYNQYRRINFLSDQVSRIIDFERLLWEYIKKHV